MRLNLRAARMSALRYTMPARSTHRMPWLALLLIAASLLSSLVARPVQAQVAPVCSWPFETSEQSLLNVAYPDTNAIYWTMPIDTSRWSSMVMTGAFPLARFMSFTSYDSRGAAVVGLLDDQIRPEQGSRNPFDPGKASAVAGTGVTYRVLVDKAAKAPKGGNHLRLSGDTIGFVIYRLYVPNDGKYPKGGVELPEVTLYAPNGQSLSLKPCPKPDLPSMPANGYANEAAVLADIISKSDPGIGSAAVCAPDNIAFGIPNSTGGYFPNPANKYIAAPDLCHQPNRLIVVRGKGAVVPNTFYGFPVWQPPGQYAKVEMRYWSLCNNNQEQPYPVVKCAADYMSGLDGKGYYTYVIADAENGGRPSWIPADLGWLPWGSQTAPNILIFRNMIPEPSFHQSVQDALAAGCTFDNTTKPVPYQSIADASACAARVMGVYHPQAVYCNRDIFTGQGWQACFTAAQQPIPGN